MGTYALGLVVDTYRGQREIGHSGSTAGYRAHLVRYPEKKLSVAVLCNVSTGTATVYAHAVANLLMPGVFTAAPAAAPAPPARTILRPSSAELKPLEGTYVSDEAETTLTAELLDGGVLALKRRPDTVIRLVPTATPDVFQAGTLGSVSFRRDATGKGAALSVRQDRVFDLRFDRR